MEIQKAATMKTSKILMKEPCMNYHLRILCNYSLEYMPLSQSKLHLYSQLHNFVGTHEEIEALATQVIMTIDNAFSQYDLAIDLKGNLIAF